MATIGKIRSRGKLLAIIIGACLLLFLVSSSLNSSSSLTGGQDTVVGEVKGDAIEYLEFNALLQDEYDRQQNNSDEQARYRAVNTVWDRLTVNRLLTDEYKAIGIQVTEEELYDLVQGDNVHTTIKKYFANPQTGQFDRANIINFLQNMDNDPSGQARQQWMELEGYLRENTVTNKYSNLLKNAWYAPTWEVEDIYNEKNKRANAKFVVVDYSAITEEIDVTEAEVKAYMAKNAKKFAQEEEIRSLDYVQFEILPSEQDSAASRMTVADEYDAFKSTDNDSIFVAVASETPFNNAYLRVDEINAPEVVKQQLLGSEPGIVTAPYFHNGQYTIAKLVDKKKIADSLQARHILVKLAEQSNAGFIAAKAKADSLKELLDNGADFAELAKANSEDPGSAVKGGDLGWVKPGQMVKPFNDACFYKGDKGQLMTVFSQFGIHIIDVTKYKATTMAAQVAFVSSTVSAGEKTIDSVFALANNFVASTSTVSDFTENSKTLNTRQVNELKSSDFFVPGLGVARGVVRWAYRNEKGDVSNVIELDDKYIVAVLKDVKAKGLRAADEQITEEVTAEIIKEKKAQMIINKYKADFASKDLEKIASATGTEVKNVDGLIFKNPYTLEFGRDIKVAGTIFGLAEGVVSEPVIGEKGVYVVSPSFFQDATQAQEFSREKNDVVNLLKNRTEQSTLEALRKHGEIEDYRYKFY